MKNYGFGYWIIVSAAISSLEDENDDSRTDNNKNNDMLMDIIHANTDHKLDRESEQLL